MKKKICIVLILTILLISFITFNEEMFYKKTPISESITGVTSTDNANPICSANLDGLINHASIVPLKGEKVEIISVERSQNVGIDVIYKIVKLPDIEANPEGQKVEFINLFGSPVGFVLHN